MPVEFQFQRIDGTYYDTLIAWPNYNGEWRVSYAYLLGNRYSGNTTTYTTHKWKFVSYTWFGDFRDDNFVSGDIEIPINSIFELGAGVAVEWYDGDRAFDVFKFKFDIAERVGVIYYITYNGNGNTGGSTLQSTIEYGKSFTFQSNGFTKTGYTFKEWRLNAANGNYISVYSSGYIYGNWFIQSNCTATAEWTANTYTIEYDANGGLNTMTPSNVTYNTTFTFKDNGFTRTGYTFSGWWLYEGDTRINDQTTYAALESFGTWTLTGTGYKAVAQWTVKTYSIRIDNGGGTGTINNLYATYGSPFTFPSNTPLTKTGYTFSSWHLYKGDSREGTETYNSAQAYGNWNIDGTDINIRAQWTAKEYTITYSANEGTGTTYSNKATYDSPYTFSNNTFTRTGYTFVVWSLYNSDNNNNIAYVNEGQVFSWSIITNVNAKAQWTAKEYTITYSTIEGTGTTSNSTAFYNSPFTFQNNGFTRTGYEFSGWHLYEVTTPPLTTRYDQIVYNNLYTINPWNIDKNLTAQAQWTRSEFTVTFDANGKGGANGTGGTIIVKQNYNTTVTCPTIKAIGYVFEGWATDATSRTVNKAGNATFTLGTANQSFFAIWTLNKNGIRFSELQSVFDGSHPISISEYRTQSGQTIANSEIRIGIHLKGKSRLS